MGMVQRKNKRNTEKTSMLVGSYSVEVLEKAIRDREGRNPEETGGLVLPNVHYLANGRQSRVRFKSSERSAIKVIEEPHIYH